MRHENIYQDPLIEHVFTPDELFDLMVEIQEVALPTGFAREINRARSMRELLDTTTTWMRHLLPADRASIAIPDGDMMQIWSLRGRSASKLDKSLPAGYGRPGRVIADHKLIISPHLGKCDQADSKMLFKAGLKRAINAPILFTGKCFGSLNITSEAFEVLGLREAVILQTLANWMAPAMAAIQVDESSTAEVMRERENAQRAKSESAMKSSFIANVSHEIRTPLNAIMGMAQMLASDDLPQPQSEKVDVVLYSARSLLTVLNDILDLSKIEAGKMSIKPLRHRPDQIIRQSVDMWRDQASQKGLVINLDICDDLPGTLVLDSDRLQQCFSNLLSNAIKFSQNGNIQVTVTSAVDGDRRLVEITVQDFGIGISSDDLPKIFDPFHQASCPKASQAKGTGLGLPICRKLARLMGGDVVADSTYGQGTSFTLSFRAMVASDLDMDETHADGAEQSTLGDLIPAGTRVLLVEDVPTNRMIVRMLLERFGVVVQEAENGLIALQCLERETFDLVLLDMQMPVMDGAAAIQRIRSNQGPFQSVPVIALTASAMVGDRERFLSMGIDGYVPKPIEERDLISEICALLN